MIAHRPPSSAGLILHFPLSRSPPWTRSASPITTRGPNSVPAHTAPGAGPAPNGFTTPGRTFHGQLTAGDSNTSYTDDDGANHTQSQGGGVPQGPDHETFGAGPYAPTNPNASPPVVEPPHPTYPNAVYYCTQNIAPEAECSRSDDGGLTFGPGVPIYQSVQSCTGSIH